MLYENSAGRPFLIPQMGYYLLSYAVAIVLAIVCGALVFKKYRNPFGWHFFVFTVLTSSWFFFYFLFFSGIEDRDFLLFISRLNFGIGIGATWSLWLFVKNFSTAPSKVFVPATTYPLLGFVPLLAAYCFTGGIVESLAFSKEEGVYREVYGPFFTIHPLLHLTAVIGLVWASVVQLRMQKGLDLMRLKRLLFAAGSLILTCLVLQLVLPIFGIWIFEKGIVFLFLAFTIYSFHALRRFYFHSGAFAGKYAVWGTSAIVALGVAEAYGQFHVLITHRSAVSDYWQEFGEYPTVRVILALVAFSATSYFLRSRLFGNPKILELQEEMSRLKRKITGITNPFDLNAILNSTATRIFRTNLCEIRLTDSDPSKKSALETFFNTHSEASEFLTDVVFVAERPGASEAVAELPKEAFLAFPLRGENGIAGFLILGKKTLSDSYSVEEVSELRKFALFLELQLRHMGTYARLQDLTINLDRKVDEKTIEYNDLINQQKEFISVISHEIKAPITNAVFQSDGMLDDLETGMTKEQIKKELGVLNGQLVRAGELLTKLFSVQYYETRSVSLFKEKVKVGELLLTELDIQSRMHPEARFVDRIDRDLKFVHIDRLQFQQVLTNLLQNALKHSKRDNPTVSVSAVRKKDLLEISVEDDGEGFVAANADKLFERYTTGAGGSSSLGMGLYLCRIIVEMHGGTIRAETSEEFGGARFIFSVPAK